MKNEINIEELTKKAENLANENMFMYKVKLFSLLYLGYFAIAGLIIILLLIFVGLGYSILSGKTMFLILLFKKKIGFIIFPIIWFLIRALWVKSEEPTGIELRKKEFPELFSVIESIRKKAKATKIHKVLLTEGFNAGAYQTSRFGGLGLKSNTLILGIELLLTLSPEQAKAVISHEIAHLSKNHGRSSVKIYQMRQTWVNIMQEFQNLDNFSTKIMKSFFNWYAPLFWAYSFPLARISEYEADKMSVELTDKETVEEALVKTHVYSSYLASYWRSFYEQADDFPSPQVKPLFGLNNLMKTETLDKEKTEKVLDYEFKLETDYDDTHPSLKDRINAIESNMTDKKFEFLYENNEKNSAEVWLAGKFKDIINTFERDLELSYRESWKERYDHVTKSKTRIKELENIDINTSDNDLILEKAKLEEEFGDIDLALVAYKTYQKNEPDDFEVAFQIGAILYEKNDDETLEQMKIALNDPSLIYDACECAYSYLMKNDRKDETAFWEEAANKKNEIDTRARAERDSLYMDDVIIPFEDSDGNEDCEDFKANMKDYLSQFSGIKMAWIAQKKVNYYKDFPSIVIVLKFKSLPVFDDDREGVVKEILNELEEIENSIFVIYANRNNKKIIKKVIDLQDRII